MLCSAVVSTKHVFWWPLQTLTPASPNTALKNHFVQPLGMAFITNTPMGPFSVSLSAREWRDREKKIREGLVRD